jgi:hypothetical protein
VRRRALALLSWWLSVSVHLLATADAAEPIAPELLACAQIGRNAERLACYDQAIEHLRAGEAQLGSAPSAESSFGVRSSEPQSVGGGQSSEREELNAVTARVRKLTREQYGLSSIELDNGQVWRQTTATMNLQLKVGDEVTISRAALGSFLMSLPAGPAIRVKRVR